MNLCHALIALDWADELAQRGGIWSEWWLPPAFLLFYPSRNPVFCQSWRFGPTMEELYINRMKNQRSPSRSSGGLRYFFFFFCG